MSLYSVQPTTASERLLIIECHRLERRTQQQNCNFINFQTFHVHYNAQTESRARQQVWPEAQAVVICEKRPKHTANGAGSGVIFEIQNRSKKAEVHQPSKCEARLTFEIL